MSSQENSIDAIQQNTLFRSLVFGVSAIVTLVIGLAAIAAAGFERLGRGRNRGHFSMGFSMNPGRFLCTLMLREAIRFFSLLRGPASSSHSYQARRKTDRRDSPSANS